MERGLTLSRVGSEWFHSVKDRQRAVEQISIGFSELAAEIMNWHAHVGPRTPPASLQWLEVDLIPQWTAWNQFVEREQASWLVRAATSWQTFVTWQEKLRHLRQLARAHGIVLTSPEPAPLPQTIWERSDSGASTTDLAPWFGVAKVAFFTITTITGAITIYTVAKDYLELRKKAKTGT